jgi:hypothetical protein
MSFHHRQTTIIKSKINLHLTNQHGRRVSITFRYISILFRLPHDTYSQYRIVRINNKMNKKKSGEKKITHMAPRAVNKYECSPRHSNLFLSLALSLVRAVQIMRVLHEGEEEISR